MQVTVTGRHFEVTPALRNYVEVRLDRMHRYTGRIQSAHVALSAEKRLAKAEIQLNCKGKDFTGKDIAEDMFSAVDRVTEKLERQLRRYKDKLASARRSPSNRAAKRNGVPKIGTLRVLSADSVGRGTLEHEILEAGDYPIEKLTVDEAILKLERDSEQEFMVFSNRATDGIHVVYRLPDGNYGVLNLHAGS